MKENPFAHGRSGAILVVLVLALSAMLSNSVQDARGAPGDIDEPFSSPGIISDFEVSPGYAFNTSNQSVEISWSWPVQWAPNTYPYEMWIHLRNPQEAIDEEISHWNLSHGVMAPSSVQWVLDNDLPVSPHYVFNITALVVNEGFDPGNDTPVYYRDHDEEHFRIENGIPLIEGIFSDMMSVDNSGTEYVKLSFHFRRNHSDLDLDLFELGFFNTDSLQWVDIDISEPDLDNQTFGDYSWSAHTHVQIPYDTPVGNYHIVFHAADVWGYSETWNRSIFSVQLRQMPPVLLNDTFKMDEDDELILELSTIFEDPNGDELAFDLADPMFENASVVLDNGTLSIAPIEDWFGDLSITLLVNDSYHGYLPYVLNVVVKNVNDPARPANDTIAGYKDTILLLDLEEFFIDIDGPGPKTFEIVGAGPNIQYELNATSKVLEVIPVVDFVGETNITIKVFDGMENATYDIRILVEWTYLYISGSVIYQDAEVHIEGLTDDQKMIVLTFTGPETYELSLDPGENYTLDLKDGLYTMTISWNIPAQLVYNVTQKRSGYILPDMTSLIIDSNMDLPMIISWKEYVPAAASWEDIDFEMDRVVKEGSEYTFNIPVKDIAKINYDSIPLRLVVVNDEEKNETVSFPFLFNETESEFRLKLTRSDLETIKKGKVHYYFTDGTFETEKVPFTFVSEDKVEANIMTIAILVILIILVLIALVFIMRKPADEEDEPLSEE
ncbi:MAG: hypothetical protein QCI82_03160 [Candidatus Thermoplasmatota archaeon]|nr:hypothetical protein [Candidatus Thermoplasmatota archaeon]